MNEEWFAKTFYKALVAIMLLGWATISIINVIKEHRVEYMLAAQQTACVEALRDFEGTALCYADSACLITGEDYRYQVHTTVYLKENCPDEWKTSQGFTPPVATRETNTGLKVGP